MRFVATIGDRQYSVDVDADGERRTVTLDGRELAVDWRLVGATRMHLASAGDLRADQFSVLVGDRSYDVFARAAEADGDPTASGHTFEMLIHGLPYSVAVQDARAQALASLAGGARVSGDIAIRAPMPGLVANVLAAEGTKVERGQTVVVLEAMKMENDLASPRAGVVKSVKVAKGQTVNQNDVLAVVGEPGEGALDESADEESELG